MAYLLCCSFISPSISLPHHCGINLNQLFSLLNQILFFFYHNFSSGFSPPLQSWGALLYSSLCFCHPLFFSLWIRSCFLAWLAMGRTASKYTLQSLYFERLGKISKCTNSSVYYCKSFDSSYGGTGFHV